MREWAGGYARTENSCENIPDAMIPAAPGLRCHFAAGRAGDAAVARSFRMTAAADRHLLFGLLALQNGIINQGQLVAAFQAWTLDKSRSLADHLEARRPDRHQARPAGSAGRCSPGNARGGCRGEPGVHLHRPHHSREARLARGLPDRGPACPRAGHRLFAR